MGAIPSDLIFVLHRKKTLPGQANWQNPSDSLLTLRGICRRVFL